MDAHTDIIVSFVYADIGIAALKILLLLFILFLALLVHELGHFFAARFFRVPVDTVEIGRGKTLFSRKDRRGTLWRLGIIPFGAHVNLSGMAQQPYWRRALIIAAGPLVNLILPFFLIAGFYLAVGQPSAPPVVVGVEKGFLAEKAGFKPGDRVLAVNGVPVLNFRDIWREAYEKDIKQNTYKIQRGRKELDITLKPDWAKYIDDDGIERSNAHYGFLWDHIAFKLSAIVSINGIDVSDNIDKARQLFIKNFDRPTIIAMKGPDPKPYVYTIIPRAAANPGLTNPGDKEYKFIYLSPTHGNFYLRQDTKNQIKDALNYTLNRIGKIAFIPFQLLPVDAYAIVDENRVTTGDTKIANFAYGVLHNLMVASILIGLLNLLPLPYLDGGYIVTEGIEAARRKPMTRKGKAWLFVAVFLILYISALFANIDNLPRYIDSRLKKVHEFMNQIQHHEKKSGA